MRLQRYDRSHYHQWKVRFAQWLSAWKHIGFIYVVFKSNRKKFEKYAQKEDQLQVWNPSQSMGFQNMGKEKAGFGKKETYPRP